jgi:hypothetical protein
MPLTLADAIGKSRLALVTGTDYDNAPVIATNNRFILHTEDLDKFGWKTPPCEYEFTP